MKEKLLNAFGELLEEESYDSMTTRAIAERAEVSYSALYAYFGSKEGLLNAYCERFEWFSGKELMSALRALPAEEIHSMTPERLAAILLKLHLADPNGRASATTDISMSELSLRYGSIKEICEKATVRWEKNICDAIEYCQIETKDTKATAQYIDALFFGAEILVRIFGKSWKPDRLISLLSEGFSERK